MLAFEEKTKVFKYFKFEFTKHNINIK